MPTGQADGRLYGAPVKFTGLIAALLGALWSGAALAQKPTPPPPPPPAAGGALEAVSLIPREAAKRLARIEAREGNPNPERWYLLVQDPETPTGLREFVVASGKIAAARLYSQFADKLTEPEVFGDGFLRADSDYCIRLANLYAAANGQKAVSFDYELARPSVATPAPATPKGEATWPIWRLTVLDANGDQMGVLTISAARGTVLAHDGFEKEPEAHLLPPPPTPPPASVTNPKEPPKKPVPKPPTTKKGKTH